MRHDLWFALRRLRLRPAHSALIILTLGVGIGASLAVFAVVDAVLLRPLPFEAAGRLVSLTQTVPSLPSLRLNFSNIGFRRVGEGSPSLANTAAYSTRDANLVQNNATRRLIVAQVSASLFDVLRVQPIVGRRFSPDEDLPGGPRAVVLSYRLWQSAFGGDPGVVGTTVNLDGEPFEVVGVLPATVSFPSREIAAWEPARIDPAAIDPYILRFSLIARLRDGAAIEAAQREVTEVIRELGREYPGPHPGSALDPSGYNGNVLPLAESVVGDVRPVVLLLLAGVLTLLLLTCANVVNLQLASVILRGEEIAVRAALGASRARLVRGALIEGLVLALGGALLGAGIALSGAQLFERLFPETVGVSGLGFGGPFLVAAAFVVLVVGSVVGALPIAVVAGRDPAAGLRERAGGGGSRTASRLRAVLASGQVALAVLLLHSAGLLIASANRVAREPLGFQPDSTVSLRVNLPASMMRSRDAREQLLRRFLADVEALPGVVAVGLVNALPLEPGRRDLAMAVEGRPFKADGTDPLADYRVASAGYFAAMSIPLIQGRLFTDDDASAVYTPIVISASLARLLFPDGEDPIGQRLRFGPAAPWMPIIGVVADAKNRSVTEVPRPELYTPGLSSWSSLAFRSEITIVARARGDAMLLAQPIQRIVAAAAPDVATYAVATLGDVVRESRARMNTTTRLMTGYALTALFLALAGTYALLSYLVSQRRHELAVRVALGANATEIARLVARESLRVVGSGAVIGVGAALLSARLLGGLLYGVGSFDLRVALVVVGVAILLAVAAALVPARRAMRVDPASALRAGG